MPNFSVADGSRFEGDFILRPTDGYKPAAAEQTYLDTLGRVTQELADEKAHDPTATDPETARLVETRINRRKTAVRELRSDADDFCAGVLAAEPANTQALAIKSQYIGRPDFTLTKGNRFDGDFDVVVVGSVHPTAPDGNYLKRLRGVTEALSADRQRDPTGTDPAPAALAEARKKRREEAANRLRLDANDFCQGKLKAEIAADNTLVIKGKYLADLERMSGSLFTVREKFEQSGLEQKTATDLTITLAPDLPPPNNITSPEKQALFVDLSSANTVIKTVCQRSKDRAERWRNRWPLWLWERRADKEFVRATRLLDQYIRKLAGIGRLGLEGPHTPLAKLALEELKREFVAEEAGRIKNSYVRSLGVACAVAALLLLGIYAQVETRNITAQFWIGHKAFLLAAVGAAIGTWLSFSIRRVTLPFQDLAVLEEDLLDPSVRVIFVIGLTMAACLLFWTGAMNIEIGALKTAQLGGTSGTIAFLVGVFCGLSERALATAISGRATTFVRSVAGG